MIVENVKALTIFFLAFVFVFFGEPATRQHNGLVGSSAKSVTVRLEHYD